MPSTLPEIRTPPPESAQDRASFQNGVALYDAGRYAEAYKIFADLSDLDAAAARNAGLMLRKGEGVARDPKAAMHMLEWAALAGLPTAQADLGEMLLNGEGNGAPDAKAALPWLKLAATAHHAIAQYHLGTLYETGNQVPRNIEEAKRLYREAAANGVKPAADRLAALEGSKPVFHPYQPESGARE